MNSSNASLHCRLEWRPSYWLACGFALLAALAIVSVWLSALPAWACVIASMSIAAYAIYQLRNEMGRAPARIAWAGGDAPVVIEHAVVGHGAMERGGRSEEFRFVVLHVRAGLVVLTLADDHGRHSRWTWWPYTLDARGRRALRLAASVQRDPALALSTQFGQI